MESSSEDDAEGNYCTCQLLNINRQKEFARMASCIYLLS